MALSSRVDVVFYLPHGSRGCPAKRTFDDFPRTPYYYGLLGARFLSTKGQRYGNKLDISDGQNIPLITRLVELRLGHTAQDYLCWRERGGSLTFLLRGGLRLTLSEPQSGGEFGVFAPVDTPGFGLPGQFGVNYAFINKVLPLPYSLRALNTNALA